MCKHCMHPFTPIADNEELTIRFKASDSGEVKVIMDNNTMATYFNYCPKCGRKMGGDSEYGVRISYKTDFADYIDDENFHGAMEMLERNAAANPGDRVELVEMRPIATAKATIEIEYM